MLLSRMWSRSQAWPSLGGEFLLWKFLFLSPGDNVCLHIFLWVTCDLLLWPILRKLLLPHTQSPHLFARPNVSPSLPLSAEGRCKKWLTQNVDALWLHNGYAIGLLLVLVKYRIPPGVFWLTPQSTICKILSFAMSAGAPRPLQSPTRFQAKLQLELEYQRISKTTRRQVIS